MRYPPLRYYLERVLRDRGGISHWAAKVSFHIMNVKSYQGRKRSTNPNYWVRISFSGVPHEGLGAKTFGMSLETQENQTLFFGGQKKPININNFSGLSREWVGVKFVYVLPFLGKKGNT